MRPTAAILFYPNIFYFAVPTELADHAIALVRGLPYGVFDFDKLAVVAKAKSLRTDPHPSGTYKDLFNRSCVMRRDLENRLIGARLAVLEQVALAYKLEPGSPGYMRLMNVGREYGDPPH